MGEYNIAVLPGDGIGPEIIGEGIKVLKSVEEATPGLSLRFTKYEAGAGHYRKTGVVLPDEVYKACLEADAMYMGAIGLPDVRLPNGTEVAGELMFKLRFELDLYAGVRPIKLYKGVSSPLRSKEPGSIDYVIIRENVEGLYASRWGGNMLRDEVATDTMVITRKGTEKIVRFAFELSRKRSGRPSDGVKVVTCVDKSNVLRSYAFFRKVYDDVADGYSDIGRDYAYIDAMSLWQVQKPENYDVVVAENMFGDIISDLGAGTVGGMGMAPSGDIGERYGLFQPSHGSAPTIAGSGIANPIATILSGGMMLQWLGEKKGDPAALEGAKKVEKAVEEVLSGGKIATVDIEGSSTTSQMGGAVAEKVGELSG